MPKQLSVKVVSLEAELEFAIQPNTTGKQLFDHVIKTMNIREIWWFGLLYTDSKGFTNWLKLKSKVATQDIAELKDNSPLKFQFRARYFPEDASEELIQDITKRLFFLQVKHDILHDEIYCPPDTSVLLASYACQARFEDYRLDLEELVKSEHLLPNRVIEQHNLSKEEWANKVINWYQEHAGMLKEDAMIEYLKIAQDLEMYGVNYFQISNKKGSQCHLGVDSLGLNIYEKEDKLSPKVGFPWSEIRNISFRNKKFIIQSVDKKSPDFTFFSTRVRTNKAILLLCMGNHELYTRRRKSDSIEVQQMKTQARDEHNAKQLERQRLLQEKQARENAERRLQEIEVQLKNQQGEQESNQRALSDYEARVLQLEAKLAEEARQRQELMEMRIQLEENNKALEEARYSTTEEFQRLKEENERIQREIQSKDSHIARSEQELEEYQRQMEALRLSREEAEKKTQELEKLLVVEDEMEPGSKEFGHDLSAADNGVMDRNEENRETAIDKNQSLQDKLRELENDLKKQRNESKMNKTDIQHEENRRHGRDKFKTLKQIRQGNTKKRVDEFESM